MDYNKFKPVIIGTDVNTYGVARSFHEAFGIKSKAFGKGKLIMTDNSKIIDVEIDKNFDDDKVMVDKLIRYAKLNPDKKLILFAASENYVFRIFSNYKELEKYYFIPYTSQEQGIQLSDKLNFYKLFEEYGLDYPKVSIASKDNYKKYKAQFPYPLVIKPSESTEYFYLAFEGKEKAYIVDNDDELKNVLDLVYSSGYKNDMIIQEYVSGPVTNEFVLNVYSNKEGQVKMMSMGQIVLDDPIPELRGNYVAIKNVEKSPQIQQLMLNVKGFLEQIKFTGLSNFDFKLDDKDGKIKCFEINLRQGRSSYCSIMSGANYAIPIVHDILENRDEDIIYGWTPFIWLNCTRKTFLELMQSIDPSMYHEIKDIDNVGSTIYYKNDLSLFRKYKLLRYLKLYDTRVLNSFGK